MTEENKKKEKKLISAQRIFFFVLILLMLCGSFFSGYLAKERGIYFGLGRQGIINTEVNKPDSVDFSLFWQAWKTLKEKTVENPDSKTMTEGAISGMLASLGDPYTEYFSKEDNQRFREDIQGEFFGIGIEITQKNGYLTVVTPLTDSPAEKAGLKAGDTIVEVDGAKTSDLGFNQTINKIRGADGTTVHLAVIRENIEDQITFDVMRGKITVKSVSWELKTIADKKFEYIKINQFGDDTSALFDQAVKETLAKNPDGIILDLRNNPGGYLETSIDLASYFIKQGVIVSERGKNNSKKDYNSYGNGELAGFKTVVLTNSGSASASEILAGALQDRMDHKVIGEKTFGKGSVQEVINLSDGSALKITVASWFTPSGRQINKEGIEPNISIADDENTKNDEQLDRAIEYLISGK